MSKAKNIKPPKENDYYKVEIIDKNNDGFFEKYSTALSIIISALLTIGGWVINNNLNLTQDKSAKFLELKNEKIYDAYKDLMIYNILKPSNSTTKEIALNYTRALIDIQVYGTVKQIKLAKESTMFYTTPENLDTTIIYSLDPLLNELRNSLRKDFELAPLEVGNFSSLDPILKIIDEKK